MTVKQGDLFDESPKGECEDWWDDPAYWGPDPAPDPKPKKSRWSKAKAEKAKKMSEFWVRCLRLAELICQYRDEDPERWERERPVPKEERDDGQDPVS